ncbi:hypothetical protein HDV02_003472 [Globomyces sp. JEL0801]|nr:hypothetical protein HDV02_003472 [Globomyces sp. JEL0801]
MVAIIRLLDTDGVSVQDSISGDYEDSFCLETFEDLCKMHFDADPKNTKGFIIARVQTWDPKQPGKRYIHRLHVLNPLTNSDIIGNVQYYIVNPKPTTDSVIIKIEPPPNEDAPPLSAISTKSSKFDHGRVSLVTKKDGITEETPDVSVKVEESANWTLAGHKVAYEENEKQKGAMVATLMKLNRRFSTTDNKPSEISTRKETTIEVPSVQTDKKRRGSINVAAQMPQGAIRILDETKVEVQPGVVTRFTVPVTSEEMASVVPKTQKNQRRSLSYRNAVSASGVPVTFLEWAQMVQQDQIDMQNMPEGQEIDHDRVEFSQVITSPTQMTPGGLMPIIDDEEEEEEENPLTPIPMNFELQQPYVIPINDAGTKDVVVTPNQNDHITSPVPSESAPSYTTEPEAFNKEATVQSDTAASPTKPKKLSIQINTRRVSKPAVPIVPTELTIFDAVLFSNDNEFLETSKVRQIFRNNAIVPEDAKLFEMKEFTGDDPQQDFEIVGEAFPCENCYPSEEELREMNPCIRFLHIHKCILLACGISIMVVGFILVMMLTGISNKSGV